MRSKKPEAPVEPWYRQGWPWFLIALPATAVVAGIATLVIAAKTFDGMVVDDYYKEGQAIVQTIGRVEHARELGLRAALRIRSDSIHVELTATEPGSLPDEHPPDRRPPHARVASTRSCSSAGAPVCMRPTLAPLSTGRWLFVIQDEARSWRMDGSAYLPAEMEIRMDPNV
jgi:hypothetical protein